MGSILVVEDEQDVIDILSVWLDELGYGIEAVNNVDSAVELLHENNYFAVISDLKMPGKDGGALLDYIKDSMPSLAKRFILITGTIANDELEANIKKQGAHLLRKPFMFDELKEVISALKGD